MPATSWQLPALATLKLVKPLPTRPDPTPLPRIEIEKPTISIYLGPNTSPFKGREGEFNTSRQIADRLNRELETNVALHVEPDVSALRSVDAESYTYPY